MFAKQLDMGDESFNTLYYVGLTNYLLENITIARDAFSKAYQIDSSNVDLIYHYANALNNGVRSANSESLRLYRKAIDMLQPDGAMMSKLNAAIALSYHNQEEFEMAIPYYQKAYDYNPDYFAAMAYIGYCYERLKNYEQARKYYELYLSKEKPGSKTYKFVEEGLNYVKGELFMNEPKNSIR